MGEFNSCGRGRALHARKFSGVLCVLIAFSVYSAAAESNAEPQSAAAVSQAQQAPVSATPQPPPKPLSATTKSGIIIGAISRFFKTPDRSADDRLMAGAGAKLASISLPDGVQTNISASEAGRPEVHLVGVETDACKRYKAVVPSLPIPPFNQWRQWFDAHALAVHCVLEWRTESGEWFHGELRSSHYDEAANRYMVGGGEFPGTGYTAYGIYILPGRLPRGTDPFGRPVVVTIDEKLTCDYRDVEREMRKYGAFYATAGDAGTGGGGTRNVGLGGPAYKPAQNSNTMVKYILRACGVNHEAPNLAVGWDTEPHFPYSTNAEVPKIDGQ